MPPFAPYVVKTVAGVKVAVIGTTPPVIAEWEKPDNIRASRGRSPVEGVRLALEALEKEKPDVVIVASHGGLDREPGEADARSVRRLPDENPVLEIAEAFPKRRPPSSTATPTGASRVAASARCFSCSRATGRRNWRASTSRCVRGAGSWRLDPSHQHPHSRGEGHAARSADPGHGPALPGGGRDSHEPAAWRRSQSSSRPPAGASRTRPSWTRSTRCSSTTRRPT